MIKLLTRWRSVCHSHSVRPRMALTIERLVCNHDQLIVALNEW
jgi:hypothetical protein